MSVRRPDPIDHTSAAVDSMTAAATAGRVARRATTAMAATQAALIVATANGTHAEPNRAMTGAVRYSANGPGWWYSSPAVAPPDDRVDSSGGDELKTVRLRATREPSSAVGTHPPADVRTPTTTTTTTMTPVRAQ